VDSDDAGQAFPIDVSAGIGFLRAHHLDDEQTDPPRLAVERSPPPTAGRLQIGLAEIKSESVADFVVQISGRLAPEYQQTSVRGQPHLCDHFARDDGKTTMPPIRRSEAPVAPPSRELQQRPLDMLQVLRRAGWQYED